MKDISLQALVRALREEEEVDLPGDQEEIDVAEPKGKITAADFKKLRSMKKEGNEIEPMYVDWDEYVKPDYITVTLKDGRKLKIQKKHIKGGKEMYQAILQAFINNRYDVTNRIVTAMVKELGESTKQIKESGNENWPKEIPSRYADEFLFIHDDNKPGFYNVKDVQTGKIVDRYGFRTPKSAVEFAQNKIKPLSGRQSSQFESSLYEGPDHEVAMAMSSLKEIVSNATQLMQKLGDMERNIPGWIQDHITNAENYIEQANQGFHELG